jgi:voltage-gated potassium channel
MLLGVGMIALPVAIIATGFSQESNRHQFVVTWSMVARVPLFASMDESEIAEICKLLYTRTYLPGVPIVCTGDAGDAMFLIAGGEAVVEVSPSKQVVLKEGDFFGEMALLERRRHKHDVVAKTKCRVYVLDATSLARLSARHPEILQRIRGIAAARAATGKEASGAARERKVRPPSKNKRGAKQAV